MTEHTPTPWVSREVRTSCGRCFKIGSEAMVSDGLKRKVAPIGVYDDYGVGATENSANAAFIIKACNAHDALVAALKLCMDRLEDMDSAGEVNSLVYRENWEALPEVKAARAALNLAGEA